MRIGQVEKIERYIEKTTLSPDISRRYQIESAEAFALLDAMKDSPYITIQTIFEYGRAKGYRAAKAEARMK